MAKGLTQLVCVGSTAYFRHAGPGRVNVVLGANQTRARTDEIAIERQLQVGNASITSVVVPPL